MPFCVVGVELQMDDMTVKINRGEDSVRLWFLTVMTEDASTGRVLQAGYTQQMAEDTIKMEYTFGDTEVLVTSVQSGKTHTSSLPPVGVLSPVLRLDLATRLASGSCVDASNSPL